MVNSDNKLNPEATDSGLAKSKKFWKTICYISIIAFLFSAFIIYNYRANLINIDNPEAAIQKEDACLGCVRRLIDGVLVKKGEENIFPVAIMIDNHFDARPAFGLGEANLVYEVEAEGRITRYLAIFAGGNNIEKIGPVRSVRPYYLDWAHEFSALFIHCGGSPEALVRIAKENINDLNEFYNGSYFWRGNNMAPHNIYISSENIASYLKNKKLNEVKYLSWKFKDPLPAPQREVEKLNEVINIKFRDQAFEVNWKYDIIDNVYVRNLGGILHKTADGKVIKAKNVIIQFVESEIIDEELRLKINTIGTGKSIICLDGNCSEGTWTKNNLSSRTRFYYANGDKSPGQEVEFNAGKTWIEIIRNEKDVIY